MQIHINMRSRAAETFIHKGQQKLAAAFTVVAKGDAREVGDRELELFQICQSSKFFYMK